MLRARGNGPLKAIGATASADIEAALGVRTRLFLHVVVQKRRRVPGGDAGTIEEAE
jgi:GTPase Era involved in 16S rRNA processing